MMSMLSAFRAADMYAKGKVSIPRPHSTRKARYEAAPCARSPTHQSRILPRYTLTEHRVSHKFKFSTNIVGISLKFLVVEREYFFPGLPFLTINPMFPVARARAARALEGRGEGRTRASALPTDSLAPPAPRV